MPLKVFLCQVLGTVDFEETLKIAHRSFVSLIGLRLQVLFLLGQEFLQNFLNCFSGVCGFRGF